MLSLYCLFHCNLFYSSIEEEERSRVIARCYHPMLRLTDETGASLAMEMPAVTLEEIDRLDPDWIKAFRERLDLGACELVGSGYAQIIGPLVPPEVVRWNLRLGMESYEKILDRRPGIALVNEQAYTSGLVSLYLDAGFQAIVMDWENPASHHPDWESGWRYYSGRAAGCGREEIAILWSSSITFQKFQRHAHGETSLEDVLDYLQGHLPAAGEQRYLSLYTNDAEIFDFRPGRFRTEPILRQPSEWQRIADLLRRITLHPDMEIVPLSVVLADAAAGREIPPFRLESPWQPVVVKKQPKYSSLRWAVSGRDDLALNTLCHRLHDHFIQCGIKDPGEWRRLCRFWSSDYRTHLTAGRWKKEWRSLHLFLERHGLPTDLSGSAHTENCRRSAPSSSLPNHGSRASWTRRGKILTVTTPALEIVFNLDRGMAMERLTPAHGRQWLIGTLPHGYYEHIHFAADFYTGHLVVEEAGRPKNTDLVSVEPEVLLCDDMVEVTADISTSLGMVRKCWRISMEQPRVSQGLAINWPQRPHGSIRLGHITLNPAAFDRQTLFYSLTTGDGRATTLPLASLDIDHTTPLPPLLSAAHGFSLQAGGVVIGDRERRITVTVDNRFAALAGMLVCRKARPTFFCRLVLTAQETDDTFQPQDPSTPFSRFFNFSLTLDG